MPLPLPHLDDRDIYLGLRLKRREIPGFDFEIVDKCSILGNVRLAQTHA
jgi:hypothetical protein